MTKEREAQIRMWKGIAYQMSPEQACDAVDDLLAALGEARAERDRLRTVADDVLKMFDVPVSVMGGEAYNLNAGTLKRARAALAATAPAPASDGWRETAKTLPPNGWGPILMRERDDPNAFCIVCYTSDRWEYWSSGDPVAADDLCALWMPIPPLPPAPCAESEKGASA